MHGRQDSEHHGNHPGPAARRKASRNTEDLCCEVCHTHREKRREIRGLENLHSEPLTTMPFAPGVHKATGNRSVYSGYREYAGLSGRVDIGEVAGGRRLAKQDEQNASCEVGSGEPVSRSHACDARRSSHQLTAVTVADRTTHWPLIFLRTNSQL